MHYVINIAKTYHVFLITFKKQILGKEIQLPKVKKVYRLTLLLLI